ncbi:MAG: hypothetical protein RL737_606 [Bacteroidota bacterium]|jgi:predicted transcriptional regulator
MENNKVVRDFVGLWIPSEILKSTELSPTEKLILVEISNLAKDSTCWASNEHFSINLGISERTVSRAINTMIEKNFISATYSTTKDGTLRYLSRGTSCPKPARQVVQNPLDKLSTRRETDCLPKVTSIENNNKENNNKENISSADAEIFPFEDFWRQYGKKESRFKAEEKFNKLTSAEKLKIKNTLAQYIKDTPDVKFRKHPLTYLNSKTWLDYEGLPLTPTKDYMTCTYYDLPDEFCIEHFGKTKKELGTACYLGDIEGTVQDLLEKKLRELGRTYFANWF